jgi:uncharacterized protein YecE (DUF72 family)
MGIRIGCGSWGDQEYGGLLYPPGLPPARRLAAYAESFDYVEVNSSYYACPRRNVVENWIRQTPPGFLFDLKLHRNMLSSIAKKPRLKPTRKKSSTARKAEGPVRSKSKDLLAYFFDQIAPLIAAKKLGALLLLLPPRFGPDRNGLGELDLLVERTRPHPLAVEFRHRAWLEGKNRTATLDYFRRNQIAWVSVDMPRLKDPTIMPVMDEATSPALAYLRLHGRNRDYLKAGSAEERHTYLYGQRELKEIAARARKLAAQAAEVRVVANNHARDFAPRTALALKALLKSQAA